MVMAHIIVAIRIRRHSLLYKTKISDCIVQVTITTRLTKWNMDSRFRNYVFWAMNQTERFLLRHELFMIYFKVVL